MPGSTILLVTVLAFASVALALYTGSAVLARRERLRRRYGGLGAPAATAEEMELAQESWLDIDPARLGLDLDARRALRRDLIRSGYFAPSAVAASSAGIPAVIIAGLLVGYGTRLGNGCTSGHGVCGIARLSPRSLVATLLFMGAGFVTVYVTRHLLA